MAELLLAVVELDTECINCSPFSCAWGVRGEEEEGEMVATRPPLERGGERSGVRERDFGMGCRLGEVWSKPLSSWL